jgi:DNA invertase Pin-like site-specific DNA recombinase
MWDAEYILVPLEERVMCANALIPAAQYLRMSTDDQPNSITIQKEAIRVYAEKHGFDVIATYSDPGRSGIEIKHRPGLQRLIRDVTGDDNTFKAILVYDVSRWGRFQDIDESAHYEFLCRKAGIAVHYCTEQFVNDGTLPSNIMKALQRMMAADYSRQLSIKCAAGMRLLAARGFHLGSTPGYGLRRVLVSPDGRKKKILKPHERKYLQTDHVMLVPGPPHEVKVIRTIFALASDEKRTPSQIADELNRRNITYLDGKRWTQLNVLLILKNQKYIGSNVWGKTNKPFSRYVRKMPPSTWTIKRDAFTPLVSPEQFRRVQTLIQKRNNKIKKPAKYYLNEMRKVLAHEGRLSQKLLKQKSIFDHRAYVRRFGSTMRAYELIGYKPSAHAIRTAAGWQKMQRVRSDLLNKLADAFPSKVRIVTRPQQSCRRAVELDNHVQISVYICRPLTRARYGPRWRLVGNRKEEGLISLICFTDKALTCCTDFYVVPEIGSVMKRYKVLRAGHPLLSAGTHLNCLSEFYDAAQTVIATWKPGSDVTVAGDTALNERASLLKIANKEFKLSRIETMIFKMLLQHPSATVSSDKLQRFSSGASEWFIRAHISALRKKLGVRLGARLITVVNCGYVYKLKAEPKPPRGAVTRTAG